MVNIGGLGPRRVPINTIKQLPCPTKPEDNPYSLLPTTDLVYLDAMGTGYSKVAEGYDPKKVWGVDGDADAFMRGIAQWLTTHERWNTPLYLYGESYGTMRNSVLMRVLGERGIALTGVIEQSTILDYAPTLAGNDLYYMACCPSTPPRPTTSGRPAPAWTSSRGSTAPGSSWTRSTAARSSRATPSRRKRNASWPAR